MTLPDTQRKKYSTVTEEQLKEEIAEARAEYFRAADSALEKIRLRFGEGRDGFLNFLNSNDVESVKPQKQNPS